MKTIIVVEGKARISVPLVKRKSKTASKKDAAVFYNPEMELSRDISVSALQAFYNQNKIKLNICDALSASGIRGIRYAKEIKGITSVTMNDKNPICVKLIKKNIKNSKAKKTIVTKKDANILLRENVYNIIDIDPFGSPNIFLDSAARSIWHRGMLAVTATDTAPLSGTYPLTCLKKYGIQSMKTPFYPELGMRILITHIILALSRYERAFLPLLSHATSHYFRVYGKIEHSGKIKSLLKDFGYLMNCNCGLFSYGKLKSKCECGKNFDIAGPIYLGPIQERKFVQEVKKDLAKRKFLLEKKELKLLNLLTAEANLPPFYYNLHYLAKKKKLELKKIEEVIKRIKEKGFRASRTHFCPTAIKTNCPLEELI